MRARVRRQRVKSVLPKAATPDQGRDRNHERFVRACTKWDDGALGSAFRLFLNSAKAGDVSAQLNLGYFYDEGIGVRVDKDKALRWYRRALAGGSVSAAGNIGLVFRDRGILPKAIKWLQRAIESGDDDSALELGKLYLKHGRERDAVKALRIASRSQNVTPYTREQAQTFLGGSDAEGD